VQDCALKMNPSTSVDGSQPHPAVSETANIADRQLLSPRQPQSTSSPIPEPSASETLYSSPVEQKDDAVSTKAESASSSKIKKKFSELDIVGAMADLDIRKSGKRSGIEDFYIQLDEPHRMFWCPGDVVKGTPRISGTGLTDHSGQVYLALDKPVKTQFVILKLTGLLSVSMVREKVEYVICEQELVLWGTRIHPAGVERTCNAAEDGAQYDTSKKQKEDWDIGTMEEGEHPFPFELDLPAQSIPSSIDVRIQD
jgi:hypothetical protein